jgi:hypothetical protein
LDPRLHLRHNANSDSDSYPNTNSYTDSNTYSDPNTDSYPNTNANAYPDSNTYTNSTKLPSVCCRYQLYIRPGGDECRWLLHV